MHFANSIYDVVFKYLLEDNKGAKHFISLFLAGVMLVMSFQLQAGETVINHLKVQDATEPLAVEDMHPLFSWQMQSDVIGQKQQAYRIVVTRESDNRVVWDSQKVADGLSVNIPYMGVALQPETAYRWQLTVWDASGKDYSAASRFETGLMNPKIAAWDGALWIGSKQLNLDATAHHYFELSATIRFVKGEKASLILGANDFRLNDAFQNHDNLAGENYVRVELDLSGVGSAKGAVLNIYRVGYAKSDRADVPFLTISAEKFPKTNINTLFTATNKNDHHTLSIFVENSNMYFHVDGVELLTGPPEVRRRSSFTVGHTNLKISTASRFNISPWGATHDQNTFPHLGAIGFAALPRCEVEYTDYQVKNCGHSIDNVVFDHNRYAVFKPLNQVTVNGATINVRNDSDQIAIGYVDPSHSALTLTRTTFETNTSKKVTKAKLYATAMGAYELYINGKRVGNDWFNPGASQYREMIGYHAYDVTALLTGGKNGIGALLHAGWYTGYMTYTTTNFNFFGDHEALLVKLVITYDDGSRQTVVTDPQTWKVFKDGPIRYGSFFQGERYDASKEAAVDGWTTAAYDDRFWTTADVIQQRPWVNFDIKARYDLPVRVQEIIPAKRVMPAHSADGHTYIYDMGVNMVGVPVVTLPAGYLKKGDVVILRYAEQLFPGLKGDEKYYIDTYGKKGKDIAGRPLHATTRAAMATDFYMAKDDGPATIQPSTTYHGYQYIQITIPNHKGPLPVACVKGRVLSSDELPTGSYEAVTADNNRTGKLANQLFKNIQRSQLGNFFTIPTDCPQRNERMGWTGDAQAYVRTATYNSNVLNFFRQWMVALRADQGVGSATEAPGGIGSTVPTYNQTDDPTFADGTTWAAAVCMVPWQLYIQYGNTRIIEENIETMMAWLNGMDFYDFSPTYPHLSSKATGLADWLAMDSNTPPDILNNAIYIYMMEVTAIMAEAIGRHEYAKLLHNRHALAKAEWNKAYVDPVTHQTKTVDGKIIHSQSSYAVPLNFNCFNDDYIPKAEMWLTVLAAQPSASGEGDRSFPDYTITTGFAGTPNILPALSRAGRHEEAFRMFTCTDLPSWLYPVTKGATSIWERWNGYEGAFGKTNLNNMNSFNHFALGAVGQWMYEYQLGITSDYINRRSGYKHFILQPSAGANYLSLTGSYNSNYGKIESAWTANGHGQITNYKVTVPANTTATLYLPVDTNITDFGKTDGVTFIRKTTHFSTPVAEYELVSGTFEFNIKKEEKQDKKNVIISTKHANSVIETDLMRRFYLDPLIYQHHYLPGKNSFLLQDFHLGERKTVLELSGRGSIRHIWSTWSVPRSQTGVSTEPPAPGCIYIRFYVDGESKPSIEGLLEELCKAAEETGDRYVPKPAFNYKGALNFYLPVFFDRGVRVEIEAKKEILEFYTQIDYRTNPDTQTSARLISETGGSGVNVRYINEVFDWKTTISPKRNLIYATKQMKIGVNPNELTITGPGIIRELRFFGSTLDDIEMDIFWDNESSPSVCAPLRYFFADFSNAALDSKAGESVCYFPMPFQKQARIVLRSLSKTAGEVQVKYALEPGELLPGTPNFHALFRQQEKTVGYEPYRILDVKGSGLFVGLNLFDSGHNHGGGDATLIDAGTATPHLLHGICGEDYFSLAWHHTGTMTPLIGAPVHERRYRLHLENPYPFRESLQSLFGMFANMNPKSVAFWYQLPMHLPESKWQTFDMPWKVLGPVAVDDLLPESVSDTRFGTTIPINQPTPIEVGWQDTKMNAGFLDVTFQFRHYVLTERGTGFVAGLSQTQCMTFVYSPVQQTVNIIIGHDDKVLLKVNDNNAIELPARHGFIGENAVLPLRSGWNKLVMTVYNNENVNWRWNGFSLSFDRDQSNGFRFAVEPN